MNESRTRRGGHVRRLIGVRDHSPAQASAHNHDELWTAEGARTTIELWRAGGARITISVLVAAGHALVRAGYRALLESDDRIEVVAEAADRHDAIRLAGENQPHVALLDLELAGLDDPEALAAMIFHPALARVAVMVIAPQNSEERVLSALRAGAIGVLANDVEPDELVGAVRLVARGNALLPAGAMRRLLRDLAPHSRLDGRVDERIKELTNRERQIVALAAAGLSNSEIAERVVISTATARTHVSRAMIKLHARHRAQLVAIAYETGLVRARVNPSPDLGAAVTPLNGSSRVIGMAGVR